MGTIRQAHIFITSLLTCLRLKCSIFALITAVLCAQLDCVYAQIISPANTGGSSVRHLSSAGSEHPQWTSGHLPRAPVNLDLSSTAQNVRIGNRLGSRCVAIVVGDTSLAVTPGTMLTSAERVALSQVLRGGQQSIQIGALGNAVGGTVNLSARLGQHLGNLVIPQGVTVIDNFAQGSTLKLTGNLTNAGTFLAVSTSPFYSSASIIAKNIFNQAGALLTSVVPPTRLSGLNNALTTLNLQLTATNDIVNAGIISSSGNLTITAGGSVTNMLPAGLSRASPLMQAGGNLTLLATNVINAGVINSLTGNLNIQAPSTASLVLNNTSGTLQALNGTINIGSSLSLLPTNLNLFGGDFLSSEINLYAGTGTIVANIGNVSGKLNTFAGEAHVSSRSNNLVLGLISIIGDPTYYNIGDINITDDISVGENLAILATGSITSTSGLSLISTTDPSGQGHNIEIVAGAGLTPACGSCTSSIAGGAATGSIIVDPFSPNGGNIDFSASSALRINTNSTTDNFNGGSITLVAFSKNGTGGTVTLPAAISMNNSGNGAGTSGDVSIFAGAAFSPASLTNAVSPGTQLKTSATQPTTSDGNPIVFDSHGTVTSGNSFTASVGTSSGTSGSLIGNSYSSSIGSNLAQGNLIAPNLSAGLVLATVSGVTNTNYSNGSISATVTTLTSNYMPGASLSSYPTTSNSILTSSDSIRGYSATGNTSPTTASTFAMGNTETVTSTTSSAVATICQASNATLSADVITSLGLTQISTATSLDPILIVPSGSSHTTAGAAVSTDAANSHSGHFGPHTGIVDTLANSAGYNAASAGNSSNAIASSDVIATNHCLPNIFSFTSLDQVLVGAIGGSHNALAMGTPGTTVSTDGNLVILHAGHLFADSGSEPLTIATDAGTVTIAPESAVVIEVRSGTPVHVMSVGGTQGCTVTVKSENSQGEVLSLGTGQELIIGTKDLVEEDMIPADGIVRTPISGAIEVHNKYSNIAKRSFAVEQFARAEFSPLRSSFRLAESNRTIQGRALSHVTAAARTQTANFNPRQLPCMSSGMMRRHAGPVQMLATPGTSFSVTATGAIDLRSGAIFLSPHNSTRIQTDLGEIAIKKNAVSFVEFDGGCLRAKALSGPGHVSVHVGKQSFELTPGQEAQILNHMRPSRFEVMPTDGVARRELTAYKTDNGKCIVLGDFSITSLLNTASQLKALRNSDQPDNLRLYNRIIKTAAAVEYLRTYKGNYQLRSPATAAVNL